jgi:hypothetical protein
MRRRVYLPLSTRAVHHTLWFHELPQPLALILTLHLDTSLGMRLRHALLPHVRERRRVIERREATTRGDAGCL